MSGYGLSLLVGLVILAAAIPYVARIRHPRQKPFAAYLIFLFVFVISAAVLFSLFAWLTDLLELGPALERTGPAVLFLLLIFLPALALATWQARKPPSSRGPPA